MWCVGYSYKWGVHQQKKMAPSPGALGRGQNVKYHFISITSQFQRFVYQTVCVYSQMKDTKHVRRDFHYVAWVMPQGWDFGVLGCPGGHFFFSNMVMWHIKSTRKMRRTECK